MRQRFKTIVIIGILLSMYFVGVVAQRRSEVMPQPKVLANMMLQEKKAGKLDDAPYITYFVDSLGYTQKVDSAQIRRMGKYYQDMVKRGRVSKVFTKGMDKTSDRSFAVQIKLRSKDEDDGRLLRGIEIECTDHTMIWWIVVRLKEYGLKQTEGEGAFTDLKGKGLFADTGSGSISIGCWFDKKS